MEELKSYAVKITILRKLKVEDIHKEYAKDNVPVACIKGEEGDEFISQNCERPDRFCNGAWDGLKSKVAMLSCGDDSPYTRQSGLAIHSCNDGLHPVIFKLERILG